MRKIFYSFLLLAIPLSCIAGNGALSGKFYVGNSKQVIFSQGNLQFHCQDQSFRFAENQYDLIGDANANIAEMYDGWIDLFGWGTSGHDSKSPWMTTADNGSYGDGNNDIAGTLYDWGKKCTISNIDGKYDYRTLTAAEWDSILFARADAASKRSIATVFEVKGFILLPDTWSLPSGLSFTANASSWTTNQYNAEAGKEWAKMADAGAVFFPAAGYRTITSINATSGNYATGYYWSSTHAGTIGEQAYVFEFTKGEINGGFDEALEYNRSHGCSVRLVLDYTEGSTGIDQVSNDASVRKFMHNGQLMIEKNGKIFNAQGAQIQ